MSYQLVREALETRLKTYADAEGVTVAWENIPSEWGEVFLRPWLLVNEPAQASIGVNGEDMLRGIFQVSVYSRPDAGLGDIYTRVDGLVAQFDRGVQLTAGGQTVTCERAWPSQAFRSGDAYVVPVSVSWFAYR